ncbi:MAG: endolytic transglycosylase MltG [Bacteroidales bacterium]
MTSKRKTRKSRIPFWLKVIVSIAVILIISGGVAAYRLYHAIYQPNVFLGERKTQHIYIPTGSTFRDVKGLLYENGMIINTNTFEWLAEKKNYKNNVRPGRYLIRKDMGNNELINLLRSGNQDPVRLTFNNIRLKEQLAGVVARQIEADSLSILRLLNDAEYLKRFDLTPETSKLLFIPNTYEVFWNTSAEQLLERMAREYNAFWNDTRLQKARSINLTPAQVGTLASIVQQETSKRDEYARVAGVYINRLNRNMPLQADPTVIFAVGDFGIRRVLNRHLETDSPYNTYKYAGLPPGPIALPDPRVIDGVLNFETHEYLFFCAREDFSGYHAFARTYSQHRANAQRYQNALNQRRIMR